MYEPLILLPFRFRNQALQVKMKQVTFFIFALLLLASCIYSNPLPRKPQPDRTVFSRYANSRFPFFTIDMARLQDRMQSNGRKRATENNYDRIGDSNIEEKAEIAPLFDQLAPGETFDDFDNAHASNFKIISDEFSGLEDTPIELQQQQEEPIEKRSDFRKRIHTCAFMRRMGVPIGLCFSNLRKINEENKNKIRAQSSLSTRDPYKYLERQWQGHTMLGGGVGRR